MISCLQEEYTEAKGKLDSIRKVLAERQDVQLGYDFGSVANSSERESSDIDIAVL